MISGRKSMKELERRAAFYGSFIPRMDGNSKFAGIHPFRYVVMTREERTFERQIL